MEEMKTFVVIAIVALVLFGCVNPAGAYYAKIKAEETAANTSAVINATGNVTNAATTNSTSKNSSNSSTSSTTSPTGMTGNAQDTPRSCLERYGIAEKIIFIYSDWCPHCQKMKPWVQQLQDEGFNVYWASSGDTAVVGHLRECLSGIAQLKYIPEFVCPAKGTDEVGEFSSIDDMRAFFQACGT